MPDQIIQYRIHTGFIIGAIMLLMALVFYVLTPFLTTLFMAAVVASAFSPVHAWLKKKFKSNLLASITTFFSVILLFLLPVAFLGRELVSEATGVSLQMASAAKELPDTFNTVLTNLAQQLPEGSPLQDSLSANNLSQMVANTAGAASSWLVKSATGIVAGLSLFVLHLFMFLFALFYFFLDGPRLVQYVRKLLPLVEKQKNELVQKITDLMQSIIYGMFGAAIAQGAMVGIGMAIIGVTNPIFWGTIGAMLAPIPYVGIGIVWVPTAIWLFSTGQLGKGVFFLAWCLIFVANIDNIVKPYLIGARSLLHPFAVMLVILGGVLTMGFKGLVFGPLLLTLLLAFLHIYQLEFNGKPLIPDAAERKKLRLPGRRKSKA